MDVSIVIVNYNTCQLLRDCLLSVYNSQVNFRFEVIVVDNCSSDDSVEMVRRDFPQVKLIASEINGGYAYGNNLGLRQAQGRHLLLLNADTVLPPTALQDMMSFVEEHPEAGVAGPKLVLADGSMDPACRRSFPTLDVAFYRLVGLSRRYPNSPRYNRYNLGYHDVSNRVVESVNGQAVDSVEDLAAAFAEPDGGFHVVRLAPNSERAELVLDATEFEAASQRILEAYGVPAPMRGSQTPLPPLGGACEP